MKAVIEFPPPPELLDELMTGWLGITREGYPTAPRTGPWVALIPSRWPWQNDNNNPRSAQVLRRADAPASRREGAGRPASWRGSFRATAGHVGMVTMTNGISTESASVAFFVRVRLVQDLDMLRYTRGKRTAHAVYVECELRIEGLKGLPSKAGRLAAGRWLVQQWLTGTPLARW